MSFGGGFNFGGGTGSTAGTGGFNFGTANATQGSGGFSLNQPATTSSGGFPLGTHLSAPQATTGGFSLGQPAAAPVGSTGGFGLVSHSTAPASSGGFSFAQQTSTPGVGGFSLGGTTGAAPATSATTGFNFGGGTTAPTGPTVRFNLGGTTATTTSAGGFLLGGTTQTPGFSLGGAGGLGGTSTAAPAYSLGGPPTTSSTGLMLGGAAPVSTGFALGGTPATKPRLTLGGTTTATGATGFSLGGTATTSAPATGLGGLLAANPTTTASTTGFALRLPAATTTSTTGLGGLGGGIFGNKTTATTGTTSGFNLGGTSTAGGFSLGGTSTAGGLGGTTTGGSIFSTVTSQPATTGLGGVDPKTSSSATGGSTGDSKPGDGKALKQTTLPPPVLVTVDNFKKYVKEEKSVQDNLSRMSSKPMFKVQEDVVALKQLLSVVSNGLQRNACAVEVLKRDMTQELKNAEMSQRTKDIPPGLQYENTAPTEYFQKLVEDFENHMLSYRQQIETLEGHLASLTQPNKFTAEELIGLLRKLHETFIALAAQLQQVHEAVKTQKEHYLNYRKIFLHDTKNIFEREKKGAQEVRVHHPEGLGPNPFTGMSNATAVAMATALARSQQPASVPPVAGLGQTGLGSTSLFGSTTTSNPGFNLFGSTATTQPVVGEFGGFGSGTSGTSTGFKGFGPTTATTTTQSSLGFGLGTSGGTATVRPLGFGTTGSTSLFGQTGSTAFGQTQTPTPGLNVGTAIPTFGTASPQLNLSSQTEAPFQLNKPPGSKRGKR